MSDFSKSHFCLLMFLLGFTSTSEATTPPSVQSQTPLKSTPNLNSPDEQNVADQCFTAVPCPADAKYRTMDGTCNNLNKTWWGSTGTPYVRLLKANYKDCHNNYRVSVVNGSELPSARLLTNAFLQPLENKPDVFTRMFALFGQVIAHDVLFNPKTSGCHCKIYVTHGDNSQPEREKYHRSRILKCTSMANCTHFIDASFIYGSNDAASQRARSRTGGELAVSSGSNGSQYFPTQDPSNCPFAKNVCYMRADPRANQNLELVVVETVWLRFHNFLARNIAKIHPSLATNDETLFQESRRWLIAFLQQITFGEWLPRFLGAEYCANLGLLPLTSGYATDYSPNLNPSSLADFAGAAFRTLHSNIPDYITILINGSSQSVPFSATFERAGDFLQDDVVLDSDVLDLTKSQEQKLDNQFTLQLLDHFIQLSTPTFNGSVKFGDDLVAMDIQRGRDYGLRAYNDYRQLGGLEPFRSFEDIGAAFGSNSQRPGDTTASREKIMKEFNKDPNHSKISTLLAKFYNCPDDIDYYVGSVIEASVKGVAEAHSLRCVWGEAFRRYKVADRFYYEFGGHGGAFSPAQLQFIRSIKLAHVVCIGADNISSIQPDVFNMPDVTNALTPCSELLETFLSGFKASFNS